MIYLTEQQWDNRIKTIATKRLHRFRMALTATSMGHYFNISCIVELQENLSGTIIVVDEKKYKEMRVLFMNHSDDELRERGVIA